MSVKDDTQHINKTDNTNEERGIDFRPCIYVVSLSDYNNSVDHGVWINADQEDDKIFAEINAMLKSSPSAPNAKEYIIQDYDCFGPLEIDKHEDIKKVAAIARHMTEYEAFDEWTELVGIDEASSDNAVEEYLEAYQGNYETEQDYAEQLFDDCGVDAILDKEVPDNLRPYITVDYDLFIRDLKAEGYSFTFEYDEGVCVFRM